MMSTVAQDTARWHARALMKSLTETLRLPLPSPAEAGALESTLAGHLARVGPSNFEDLGAWVVLECLIQARDGAAVDWAEVLRAADRVRHRISRQHARERALPVETITQTDDESVLRSLEIDLQTALDGLSESDLGIFEAALDGAKPSQIAARFDMSTHSVRNRLLKIRERLKRTLR